MGLDARIAGLLLIAGGVVAAGAYVAFDAARGGSAAHSTSAPQAAPAQASLPATHPKLPVTHPPVADALPTGPAPREGKVPTDPARAFSHFRVGNHSVRAIYADGSVMWVGTSGGMVRYDTGSREFRMYDVSSGLRSNGIYHVGRLRGRIAVGTYGGGLSLLDQQSQQWEHYSIPDGLGDAFVYDALEDASGDIWIATGSGVNRVRGGALRERAQWHLYTTESTGGGLPADRVYALAQGNDASIWMATEGGLVRFRQGKWTKWVHGAGLSTPRAGSKQDGASADSSEDAVHAPHAGPVTAQTASDPAPVSALAVGRDGRLWAGTRSAGLACFDGSGWKHYTTPDGLPSNRISALHVDDSGALWVGTDKGLAVLSNGKFRVLTAADGLLGESVHSVRIAADGGIWVGTFGGVARLRPPLSN